MLELDSAIQTTLEAISAAAPQAAGNWHRNLAAITATQSDLAKSIAGIEVEWLFARDGTLSAIEDGKWWGGCSVPGRAAEELLRTLDITNAVACFLNPSHPAQLALALGRIRPEQAVIALLP